MRHTSRPGWLASQMYSRSPPEPLLLLVATSYFNEDFGTTRIAINAWMITRPWHSQYQRSVTCLAHHTLTLCDRTLNLLNFLPRIQIARFRVVLSHAVG